MYYKFLLNALQIEIVQDADFPGTPRLSSRESELQAIKWTFKLGR